MAGDFSTQSINRTQTICRQNRHAAPLEMTVEWYSLIMIFVYSKVMDYVSTIFNQRKMVVIISTQHAAIREDILTHLHRGATLLSGSGGFTGEQRPVLLTVVQN